MLSLDQTIITTTAWYAAATIAALTRTHDAVSFQTDHLVIRFCPVIVTT